MTTKGVAIVILLWLTVLAGYFIVHRRNRERTRRVTAALQAFSRDYLEAESNKRAGVSITDLTAGGYLRAKDADALTAIELVFSNFAAAPMTLEAATNVVLRARLRDGKGIEVLIDGSAHLRRSARP
jgi:hypothetical protein